MRVRPIGEIAKRGDREQQHAKGGKPSHRGSITGVPPLCRRAKMSNA